MYGYFIEGKQGEFWKLHLNGKDEQFVSPEFKNLLNIIFSPNAAHRPTLADVIAHEWFKMPTASDDEVKKYFDDSKKVKDQLK
jgi:serine/threonine protein kinase